MKTLPSFLLAAAVNLSGHAQAETIFAIDVSDRLFTFDSATPGAFTYINDGDPVSGLQEGETLLAIDFRPVATSSPEASSNGTLYGISSNNRLYTINTTSGVATAAGASGGFTLSGAAFGMDFNPNTGLLGVVSDVGQNIRLNPFNGTLTATDNTLGYANGDSGFGLSPRISGSAYTNNFGGAAQTTLYGIDFDRDMLVRIGGMNGFPSPAGGQLTTVGPIGLNFVEDIGFDISGLTGTAYATLSPLIGPQDPSSGLYTIDLATGAGVRIGSIGPGGGVAAFVTRDIAVPLGVPVPEPTSTGIAVLAFAMLAGRRTPRTLFAAWKVR